MYLAQDKTLLARERFTVKLRKPRTVSLCFAQPPVYGGPQLSHQNKMLTSNSNHSHQIQITHSKLKITHSKFKLLTANYKSFTSNTNPSHQIQIAHSDSKYKSLTANTNTVSVKRGRRTADCGPGEKAD